MAGASAEWRCDVVSGSLSCAQEHSGPDGSDDDREDRGPGASVSAFSSEEASLRCRWMAGIGLAGAFEDRRHSGARRVGREGSAATSTDRSGRAGGVGSSVNSEWCVDFKGWFRTRDGRRIDPLTVTDNASRYLLEVRILRPNHEEVRPVFELLFRDFGLPDAVRSDNGPPFGSSARVGFRDCRFGC